MNRNLLDNLEHETPAVNVENSGKKQGRGLLGLLLMALLMAFMKPVKAQVGVWYIANKNSTNGHPGPVYNSGTPATNWYLVPAANPQQLPSCIDAYYSPNHATTNGNPEKPFLTTYKTNKDLNSIWLVVESGETGYYFIIHALTGKYVIYEVPLPNDGNKRKTMHLQTPDNENYSLSANQNFKFKITAKDGGYNIEPKNRTGWYWNTAGQNANNYYGTGNSNPGTTPPLSHLGLIGVYTGTTDNSIWFFESASTSSALTPVISDVDETTNTFTITSPAAAFSTIHYTTDGTTTPDATTGTTVTSGSPINIPDNWIVQAVGVFDNFITPLAGPKELSPGPCVMPVISYNNTNGEVSITTTTEGASIYYTLDGSTPVVPTGGNPPTSPTQLYNPNSKPTVTSRTVVKAIAAKDGWPNSPVASTTIVTSPTFVLAAGPYIYNRSAHTPLLHVNDVYGNTDLTDVIDPSEYTVTYSNNVNAGTATITITDKPGGNYIVNGSTTFTIEPMSIGTGGDPVPGITITVGSSGNGYTVTVKHGSETLEQGTDKDYTWEATGSDEVTVTGHNNYTGTAIGHYVSVTPGYYALHKDGVGYMKRYSDNVTLGNENTFRYGNSFDSNGSSIWIVTPEGYLQSDYYYLNVAHGSTLYLSVTPQTQWKTNDIEGNEYGKKQLKTTIGNVDYYLCNNNGTIQLTINQLDAYNACPILITETKWVLATNNSNITVQSPQQFTYLRNCYYTQTIHYSFDNDAGTSVTDNTEGGVDRRVFVKLTFLSTNDTYQNNRWDIDETNGIIYNLQPNNNTDVTATYTLTPADPIINDVNYQYHHDPETKQFKFTLQPKTIKKSSEVDKNYILFSIFGGDNFRYPYDSVTLQENDPLKPDGKGGIGNDSDLIDPGNDGKAKISWIVEMDRQGFYSFKNSRTNRYFYFDESDYTYSDYGTLKVGSESPSTSDTRYKFRFFKTSNGGGFSTCYYIIPYSKQFVVFKSDGVSASICAALNIADYSNQTTPVISLHQSVDNSKWLIYKYEAEYRVRKDFVLSGPSATYNTTDDNIFSTEDCWYGKCITESPTEGNLQRSMVVSGSYNTTNLLNYIWTVDGLNGYINIPGGAPSGTTGTTITINSIPTFNLDVTSLPVSAVTGTVQLQLQGGGGTYPIQTSGTKSLLFTIYGDGNIQLTAISSLSQITSSTGRYKLTANNTYSSTNKPGPDATTFSGILDCDGHTIDNLTAPLFTTLTNGTVRNLNLKGVNISGSGPTGAIAGTANGASRIYNCGILPTTTVYDENGNISGFAGDTISSTDGYCGSLVGLLDGYARVINCFSYATIAGGSTVAGIVGYNNYATKSNDIRTMVMNCMYYGDIMDGTNVSPVYGGLKITNVGNLNGLNNFNYFSYDDFTSTITNYNCALGAERRFLVRFEFHRTLLNSNRELAAWYVNGTHNGTLMKKWVLDKSIAPYPVLKPQGTYPTMVNPDYANAQEGKPRNQGGKLGTLTVIIQMDNSNVNTVPFHHPDGAQITDNQLVLNITDKDTINFNYNYGKVQLPYYNEVGSKNYTGNRVVTGWKIVGIVGGEKGSFITRDTMGGYNFADREHWAKDFYGTGGSNRIFNQGSYWEVPTGVSEITIEPYWAKCVYLSDPYYDVTYTGDVATHVEALGQRYVDGNDYTINGSSQKVYTTVENARNALESNASHTPFDYAIVLVGNYHHFQHNVNVSITGNNYDNNVAGSDKPYTFMSADLDFDNEPDNVMLYQHGDRRTGISPVRFDFLHFTGIGMAQKQDGIKYSPEAGTFWNYGWFEITNTSLIKLSQIEYVTNKHVIAPLILEGGMYENIYSYQGGEAAGDAPNTNYIRVGGNAYMEIFCNGSHLNNTQFTPHVPISVIGGDFDEFYLSGYRLPKYPNVPTEQPDDAECYIEGGRFGEVAGAAMWQVDGNVGWSICNADIKDFYGGGINADKPVTGNITIDIKKSYVDMFCGGPKFGDMTDGKTVYTTADSCVFGTFFGAGYGGTSAKRISAVENNNVNSTTFNNWAAWLSDYYDRQYQNDGIAANYELIFFQYSGGGSLKNVAQLYINRVMFSLATTHNDTSILTGCTVNGNFYGGGNLGKVDGDTYSSLTDCTVKGSVFGAGYSVTIPKLRVYDKPATGYTAPYCDSDAGVFVKAEYPEGVEYTWKHDDNVSTGHEFEDNPGTNEHYILTEEDLNTLGTVTGNVTLTIKGKSTIGTFENGMVKHGTGNVFGGGDESAVDGSTLVKILDRTKVFGNIYGGGNMGTVGGDTKVIINGTAPETQSGNANNNNPNH